jgi:hypothetical protein
MKYIFTFIFFFALLGAFAQNHGVNVVQKLLLPHSQHKTIAGKDTVISGDTSKENKEPQYFYFSVNTDVFVNSKGGFAKRFSPAFEFGRTYGIFDSGDRHVQYA